MAAVLRRSAFVLYGLALAIASLLPGDALPAVSYNDKLAHFAAYLILALLAAGVFSPRKTYHRLALALVAYGALLEVAQGLSGARDPSLLDAIANGSGILAGVVVANLYWRCSRQLL